MRWMADVHVSPIEEVHVSPIEVDGGLDGGSEDCGENNDTEAPCVVPYAEFLPTPGTSSLY